jgi:hypothetical protein
MEPIFLDFSKKCYLVSTFRREADEFQFGFDDVSPSEEPAHTPRSPTAETMILIALAHPLLRRYA